MVNQKYYFHRLDNVISLTMELIALRIRSKSYAILSPIILDSGTLYSVKLEAFMFRLLTSCIMNTSERERQLLPDEFLNSLTSANLRFIKRFNSGIPAKHYCMKHEIFQISFFSALHSSSMAVSPDPLSRIITTNLFN